MKKTVLKFSAKFLLIAWFALGVIACKKDKEVDDPNITYKNINRTVTSVTAGVTAIDSIDIMGDHNNVLFFLAAANATADTAFTYISMRNGAVYIDSTEGYSIGYKAKNLYTNQQAPKLSSKREWYALGFSAYRLGSNKKGYAGVGDVFIPIILFNFSTAAYHYGWIRVNVTSDYRSIKLVDMAYDLRPDTPVKMGAK